MMLKSFVSQSDVTTRRENFLDTENLREFSVERFVYAFASDNPQRPERKLLSQAIVDGDFIYTTDGRRSLRSVASYQGLVLKIDTTLGFDPFTNFSIILTEVNADIDWGDGTTENVSGSFVNSSHEYSVPGQYTVTVVGTFEEFNTNFSGVVTEVRSFGDTLSTSLRDSFQGESNLQYLPQLPKRITSIHGTFSFLEVPMSPSLTSIVENWDVSNIQDFEETFYDAPFSGDLSGWDVSSGVNFKGTFRESDGFNSDISGWDMSNATTIREMFMDCADFNADISGWDVSSVESTRSAFIRAAAFNADISDWNVSNVTDMLSMFNGATSFNQDLSGWCVANIPTQPSNFLLNTTSWTLPKPVWGTCP